MYTHVYTYMCYAYGYTYKVKEKEAINLTGKWKEYRKNRRVWREETEGASKVILFQLKH